MTAAGQLLELVAEAGFRVVLAGDGPMLMPTRDGAEMPAELLAALKSMRAEVVELIQTRRQIQKAMARADSAIERYEADGTAPEIQSAVEMVSQNYAVASLDAIQWCEKVESLAHEHRGTYEARCHAADDQAPNRDAIIQRAE